jgi:hypothetical protein
VIVEIKASVPWLYKRTKAGNYIAVCEPLAQTLQADSYDELIGCIQEALDSTFRELLKSGDLETFLKERGWKSSALPARRARASFDVPLKIERMSSRDSQVALCQ